MAFDRWLALFILILCLAYGYTAFFTMDASLPPVMKRSPVWPSSFPKILAVLSIFCALIVLLGLEKTNTKETPFTLDFSVLKQAKTLQAIGLIGMMILYAICLRPVGFLGATFGFLAISAVILGERKFYIMVPVIAIMTGLVWFLVHSVLGIYLSPLPQFLSSG